MCSKVLHRLAGIEFDRVIQGEGNWIELSNGKKVIDAAGGAAVVCIGHGNKRVANAIADQASRIAYCHTLFFSSNPAEELAELLIDGSRGAFSRVFFVSSGSEAVESALKMALQFHIERGEPERRHFIARRQSYHGNTFGALSASGHASRRSIYEPVLMPNFSFISPSFSFRYKPETLSDSEYVARCGDEFENEIHRVGPSKVAAFISETIVGASSGCVTAVPGYFALMREICDRYDILMIADEIMSGMGRSGKLHAWEHEDGYTPDIQTVAKGLGGGYVPIGAMLVGPKVAQTLEAGSGAFVHGHTYQAHPVSVRGALEVQKIIQEGDFIANVNRLAPILRDALSERFSKHPHIGDIRGRGFFQALEFVQERGQNSPFPSAIRFSEVFKKSALNFGLALYPNSGTIDGRIGDHVIIAPAFNSTETDIMMIVDRLVMAVNDSVLAAGGR
jgi:adenosylmethionine-8-amino-7-oxononanoate aminotransferase